MTLSMKELLVVNYFRKSSFMDVCQNHKYASVFVSTIRDKSILNIKSLACRDLTTKMPA